MYSYFSNPYNIGQIYHFNWLQFNPVLHGGGGGHKVPTLITNICIFTTNTATATTFGDFIKFIEEDNGVLKQPN